MHDTDAAVPTGRLAWSLTGAAGGGLVGGALGLWRSSDELRAAWARVASEGWMEQGLHRLVLRQLDAGLGHVALWILGGAMAGLLGAVLLAALRGASARRSRSWPALVVRSIGLLIVAGALATEAVRLTCLHRRATGPNVVWIIIDALRADHLGCYGYERPTSPFLDGLAADAARFRLAISQESYTLASAASFFTSRYPPETAVFYDGPGIDTLASSFVTVAEVLGDAGYDTGAFVFNPHLNAKYRFDQGFDVYDDASPHEGDGRITKATPCWEFKDTAGPMHEKVRTFLDDPRFADSGRPKFLYLHYRDVHGPYVPPPDYASMFLPASWSQELRDWADRWVRRSVTEAKQELNPPIPNADTTDWARTATGRAFYAAEYDGEIRYTDDNLVALFELLARHGIDRSNTMVIVAADHGEEFLDPHPGDSPDWSHGRTLYIEQLHVPLIVSVPGDDERGRVVEQPVELLDVAPTILDVAGLSSRTPAVFRGRSLLPLLRGQSLPERPIYSGGNHGRWSVLGNDLVYYHYEKETKARRRYYGLRPESDYPFRTGDELYALQDDPGETADLLPKLESRTRDVRGNARALQQLGAAWLARGAGVEGGGAMALQADEIENLRQLGYLQGPGDGEAGSSRK